MTHNFFFLLEAVETSWKKNQHLHRQQTQVQRLALYLPNLHYFHELVFNVVEGLEALNEFLLPLLASCFLIKSLRELRQ